MSQCASCGMAVDEKNPAAKSELKGETYYFCSSNCKAAFDKNPQQFVDKAKSAAHEHEHEH